MIKIRTLCQKGISRCSSLSPSKRATFKGCVKIVQVLSEEETEKVD